MKRTILSAVALGAVGAAALTTGTAAIAQQRGYYDGGGYQYRSQDDSRGYRDEQRWRHSESQRRHYDGRTPMGGRNPSGCYYDDGGGRIYSCDAGGRR